MVQVQLCGAGTRNGLDTHRVKSVQIRSYFWSVFSYIRIEYGDLRRKYLDTPHAVTPIWQKC